MEEFEEKDPRSKRVNLRIPIKQYERMMLLGQVLGLDSDSSILKHFLNVGLQFGGASLAAQVSSDTGKESLNLSSQFLEVFKGLVNDHPAEQTDLVKEAEKKAS